jgi:hypothetical protein
VEPRNQAIRPAMLEPEVDHGNVEGARADGSKRLLWVYRDDNQETGAS